MESRRNDEGSNTWFEGFLLDAEMPTEDLSNLTDYVVKEGSF